MSLARIGQSLVRRLHRPLHLPPPPPPDHYATVSRPFAPIHANTCVRGFASLTYNGGGVISGKFGGPSHVHAAQVLELVVHLNHARPMSSGAGAGAAPKPPSLSEGVSFGGCKVALKVDMPSPGFVFQPYRAPEPIPLWKRLFTPSGWSRTKEDVILQKSKRLLSIAGSTLVVDCIGTNAPTLREPSHNSSYFRVNRRHMSS